MSGLPLGMRDSPEIAMMMTTLCSALTRSERGIDVYEWLRGETPNAASDQFLRAPRLLDEARNRRLD
jgi:hypothetical protein